MPLVIDTMFEVQSQSWLDLALRQQQLMPRLPFQNNTATRGLMTKAPDGVAKKFRSTMYSVSLTRRIPRSSRDMVY